MRGCVINVCEGVLCKYQRVCYPLFGAVCHVFQNSSCWQWYRWCFCLGHVKSQVAVIGLSEGMLECVTRGRVRMCVMIGWVTKVYEKVC